MLSENASNKMISYRCGKKMHQIDEEIFRRYMERGPIYLLTIPWEYDGVSGVNYVDTTGQMHWSTSHESLIGDVLHTESCAFRDGHRFRFILLYRAYKNYFKDKELYRIDPENYSDPENREYKLYEIGLESISVSSYNDEFLRKFALMKSYMNSIFHDDHFMNLLLKDDPDNKDYFDSRFENLMRFVAIGIEAEISYYGFITKTKGSFDENGRPIFRTSDTLFSADNYSLYKDMMNEHYDKHVKDRNLRKNLDLFSERMMLCFSRSFAMEMKLRFSNILIASKEMLLKV